MPAVAVEIVEGFQVPVMAGVLAELGGRAGAAEFWQRGPIWVNAGVICGTTTISMVVVFAQEAASGVKV